jgi:hypothetical protein
MTKHGFARSSEQGRGAGSRTGALRAAVWTLSICPLVACSGSTDVVGVLPAGESPVDVGTGSLEGASEVNEGIQGVTGVTGAEGAPGELSIVAGLRVDGWDERDALDWPFSIPLRDFFANGGRAGSFGPPPGMQRELIAVMGRQAKIEHVRVVAAGPEVAERLRDVFAEAEVELDGEMVARVMRDWRSDEYRVALGPASCGYSSSHHGGSCAEASSDESEHP